MQCAIVKYEDNRDSISRNARRFSCAPARQDRNYFGLIGIYVSFLPGLATDNLRVSQSRSAMAVRPTDMSFVHSHRNTALRELPLTPAQFSESVPHGHGVAQKCPAKG
jgi:hypothetical protein